MGGSVVAFLPELSEGAGHDAADRGLLATWLRQLNLEHGLDAGVGCLYASYRFDFASNRLRMIPAGQ